jgi:hypothetical protein
MNVTVHAGEKNAGKTTILATFRHFLEPLGGHRRPDSEKRDTFRSSK